LNQNEDRRKISLKKSTITLKKLLKTYDCTFKKDLDEMWNEHDVDQNGYLDRDEAQPFLDEVAKIIDKERAKNY